MPATYDFAGADFSASANRIKMAVELNSYLGSATSTVLDETKANNLFTITGAPFTTAALNTSGVNLAEKTADVNVYKEFISQQVKYSSANSTPAAIRAKPGIFPGEWVKLWWAAGVGVQSSSGQRYDGQPCL